jgi:hypothetical protein
MAVTVTTDDDFEFLDPGPHCEMCEWLGAELIEIVRLPEDNDMYLLGDREKCRYRLKL